MNKKRFFGWIFIFTATILVCIVLIQPYFIIQEKLTNKDKKVAAFYYGWYSNSTDYSQTVPFNIIDDKAWRHWDGTIPSDELTITNHPIYGLYDSADPFVIEKHLRQGEWAELDSFILSYWGINTPTSDNFINMLEVAKYIDSNLSLSLYFETGMGDLPKLSEDDAVDFLYGELKYIYGIMTSDEYKNYIWYEDNKPVLFAYVVQWLTSTVWGSVLNQLEKEGISFYLVADRPGFLPSYNSLFQATHQYDGYAPVRDNIVLETNLRLKKNAMRYNQLYIASVHPGYDDTNVREGNTPMERQDGDYYGKRWEDAISMNPDWIAIVSWNEWHEGTEIEPSVEHGNKALKQTKNYIEEFKSGNYDLLSQNINYLPEAFWSIIALFLSWIIFLSFPISYNKFSGKYDVNLNLRSKKVLLFLFMVISWIGLIVFLMVEAIVGYLLLISGEYYILLLSLFTFINRYADFFHKKK